MTDGTRLGKTTTIHFVSQVVTSVAGFVATFYIARELGADILGTYAVVVALLVWLTIPSNALRSANIKRLSERRNPGSFLSASLLLDTALAAVIVALVLVLSDWINAYIGVHVHGILAVLLVIYLANGQVLSALKGQKKVAASGVVQAAERTVRTGFQIGLVLLGYGITGLLVGHVGSLVVAIAIGLVFFEVRPSLPTREHFRSLVAYARYAWLGNLKTQTFAWMDTIVLAFFVGNTLIGIYEVAWNLASILALVSISIQSTLFPEMSELSVDDDYDRIHHYLDEGLVFTGVFLIPGLFGAAVMGPQILSVYSSEFSQGAFILLILIAARAAAAFGMQLLSAINAINRPDIAFRINFVFVVSNLGLNVVLVFLFGWYGAAVATAVSAATILGLSYYLLSQLIGRPRIPTGEIAKQIAASIVMAAVLFWLAWMFPTGDYVTVGLVFFASFVYGTVLLAVSSRVRGKVVGLLPYCAAM